MPGSSPREARWAVLVTLVLLASAAGLGWAGLRTGHLAVGAPATATPSPTTSPSPTRRPAPTPSLTPTPSPTLAVVPPDPELVADFDAVTTALGGEYALAWVDRDGLHVLGELGDQAAWSTIKVPLAIAAAQHAASQRPPGQAGPTNPWPDVEAAITRSDNDAAARLWGSLGQPEEAAAAVDEVLSAYDSGGTATQQEVVRPPFSSFGQTQWSLPDQARFAAALACSDETSVAAQVRAAMARVVPDHRWGIGGLADPHLKSGWGPVPAGAYTLRQLGDGTVDDQRYAMAVAGRAASGTYAQAGADLDKLVDWWGGSSRKGEGLVCRR